MPHRKGYPPTYTRLAQLERKEQELERFQNEAAQKPFVEAFCQALGTLAAHTPRSRWPKEFEAAFRHARKAVPTGALIYLSQLPKD